MYHRITPTIVAINGDEEYKKEIDKAADSLYALSEGKNRDLVKGATFKELKECVTGVYKCGYFQSKGQTSEQTEQAIEQPTEPEPNASVLPNTVR